MAIQIKHPFVSLKGDGTDATQVQPTAWNAAHSFTMATGMLVGRLSAGAGNAEEIPISAYMASLLVAADAATLATLLGVFETGDVKYTFKNSATAGWIICNVAGSIGSAASGATLRANADTLALYTLIYNAVTNTYAPVSGGRTGNPTNDFNANKTLTIPNLVGRVPVGAGNSTAVTSARDGGTIGGEETTALSLAQLPTGITSSNASQAITVTTVQKLVSGPNAGSAQGGGTQMTNSDPGSGAVFGLLNSTGNNAISVTSNNTSGQTHNTLQPFVALYAMLKL